MISKEVLYKDVFNTFNSIADSTKDLENVTNTYPYFALGHYFLLQSKKEAQLNFTNEAAKANLFFTNPFLLQHHLTQNDDIEVIGDDKLALQQTTPIIEFEKTETLEVSKEEVTQKIISKDEPLLFEPLYTTDYFASQGIKLSDKVLDNDKLGQQLKSFTSWLKTMKKVHPTKNLQTTVANEAAIQALAEKSNVEEEVYTEAMAEAFTQQGKQIRAMEVYTKLSLMFPEKSAYFAAKIDNLK
jgi:hypothetical protein